MKNENKTTKTTTPAAVEHDKEYAKTTPPKPHAIQGTISGAGYAVKSITVGELKTMLEHLPAVQTVRGNVWPDGTAAKLVSDVRDGKYVPPIVLGGVDALGIQDGQQRATALTAAAERGEIDPATPVLIAVDTVRTAEECFAALNVGVPVGKSLVAAMGYAPAIKDTVLSIAAAPVLSGCKWTMAQMSKTARAAHASAAVAIFGGWSNPESNERKCNEWLTTAADTVTADDMDKAKAAIAALSDAAAPYITVANGGDVEGVTVKASRRFVGNVRRRGYWLSMIGAMFAGADPAAIVHVFSDRDDLLSTAVNIPKAWGKDGSVKSWHKGVTYKDYVGGGSSGSNAEYTAKVAIVCELCKEYAAHPDKPTDNAEAEAMNKADEAAAKSAAAAADMLGSLGV